MNQKFHGYITTITAAWRSDRASSAYLTDPYQLNPYPIERNKMPYRRSLGRFSKRTWEDFNDEVHRAQNEHLMDGIVAGCALVAYADGWVTEEERVRMLGLIRGFEPVAAFGLDDVATTFASMTARFASDQKAGEQAAFEAVAQLKGAGRYPELLVEACCIIAAADGGFDAEERLVAIRICETLGLEPAEFGLAEAP